MVRSPSSSPAQRTPDRRDVRLLPRQPGGRRRARHLHALHAGKVSVQPGAALSQRLGIGRDSSHVLEAPGSGHQLEGDPQQTLAADREVGLDQRVQRLGDHAFGGVLDGNDSVIRLAALHRCEDVGDGRDRDAVTQSTEDSAGGEVREGSLGPEEGHPESRLQGAGRGDDLAKDVRKRGVRERPRIRRGEAGDQVALASSVVHGRTRGSLALPDLLDQPSALVQLLEQRPIHRVDRLSQALDLRAELGIRVRCGRRRIARTGLVHCSFRPEPSRDHWHRGTRWGRNGSGLVRIRLTPRKDWCNISESPRAVKLRIEIPSRFRAVTASRRRLQPLPEAALQATDNAEDFRLLGVGDGSLGWDPRRYPRASRAMAGGPAPMPRVRPPHPPCDLCARPSKQEKRSMLNRQDDFPIHQTPDPIAAAVTGDRNVYDRYFFNGYSRDGALYFAAAMGLYANREVLDASFSVVRGGVQTSVHASRRAPLERTETRVGPIAVEVLDPMRSHRLRVADNEAGVRADLRFDARTVAVEEPRFTRRSGTRIRMDSTRFTQWGTWQGVVEVGESASRSIRASCSAPAIAPGESARWGSRREAHRARVPQFFWLWAPLHFDDLCAHFDEQYDESGGGRIAGRAGGRCTPPPAARENRPVALSAKKLRVSTSSRAASLSSMARNTRPGFSRRVWERGHQVLRDSAVRNRAPGRTRRQRSSGKLASSRVVEAFVAIPTVEPIGAVKVPRVIRVIVP